MSSSLATTPTGPMSVVSKKKQIFLLTVAKKLLCVNELAFGTFLVTLGDAVAAYCKTLNVYLLYLHELNGHTAPFRNE